MGFIFRTLKLGTKISIVGGSAYFMIQEGTWGSPEQSQHIPNKVYASIPGLKEFDDEYIAPFLPSTNAVNSNLRHYWNRAIVVSTDFLVVAPSKAAAFSRCMAKNAQNWINGVPETAEKIK